MEEPKGSQGQPGKSRSTSGGGVSSGPSTLPLAPDRSRARTGLARPRLLTCSKTSSAPHKVDVAGGAAIELEAVSLGESRARRVRKIVRKGNVIHVDFG